MPAQDGAAGTELDDRDPAQLERPHPEALERQVEQRQQQDLEDAVVADDDRPRAARSDRRSRAPASDRACPGRGPRRAVRAGCAGRRGRGRGVGERLAARRPDLGRTPPPGRELVAEPRRRPRRDGALPTRPGRSRGTRRRGAGRRAVGCAPARSRSRSPRRGRAGSATTSSGGPAGIGRAGVAAGGASRAATRAACARPRADSGESARPWNRPSTMNSISPWRTRTSVASSPSGIEPGSLSARRRAGSSRGR